MECATNQLSIEIAEKTKAENSSWVASGIYRNDNSWLYIQGNPKEFFIFAKKDLINLHKTKKFKEMNEYPPTVWKYFLPIDVAKDVCLKHIICYN